MDNNDLHDIGGSAPTDDDLFQPFPDTTDDSSISDILRNILPSDNLFYED
jgi:hypothetical protein